MEYNSKNRIKDLIRKTLSFASPVRIPAPVGEKMKGLVSKAIEFAKPEYEKGVAISKLPIKEQAQVQLKRTGNTVRDIVGGIVGGQAYVGRSLTDTIGLKKLRESAEGPNQRDFEKKIFGKLSPTRDTVQEFVKKDVIPFSEKYNLPKGLTVPVAAIGSLGFESALNPFKSAEKGLAKTVFKEFLEGRATREQLKEGLVKSLEKKDVKLIDDIMDRVDTLKENDALDESFLDNYVKGLLEERGVKTTEELPQLKQPEVEPQLPKSETTPQNISLKDIVPEEQQFVKDEDLLREALSTVKPLRKEQEKIYSKERSKRLGKAMGIGESAKGEAGFFQQLGALKGEINKVDYESIRHLVDQGTIDRVFDRVRKSPKLFGFQKINAQNALLKMFSKEGGEIPTRSEITLLEKIFKPETIETLLDKRPQTTKVREAIMEVLNIPRSIMSGFFDFSFGGRQGIFAAPRYRKEFFDSWKKQFKIFGSEKMYQESLKALESRPLYEEAVESGISFTDVGKVMSEREERYASQWAERIPVLGRSIRATGRAYTAFANKFRMDIYEGIWKDFENLGIDVSGDFDLKKSMAKFVNSATGRGDLPKKLEPASDLLNALFFSPRLMASRLTLLNPVYYAKQPAPVRKEALKTMATFLGAVTTVLTGVSMIPGVTVGTDPKSSDFGKIKIGNTRLDIAGGFQQYIRMAAQLLTGKYVSSITGKELTLGEGYKPLTRFDILLRQFESKEAPIPSLISTILKQQTYTGEKVNVKKEILDRLTPMVISDIRELIKDDPDLLPLIIPAIFGASVQTYSEKNDKIDLSAFSKKSSSSKVDLSAFK